MAAFHQAGRTRINAFHVGEAYLFRHYFEDDDVFDALKRYYSSYDYRFEVPESRFGRVDRVLDEHGYALAKVPDPAPFAVVKRKYTDHPTLLFKGSVLHRSLGQFNCFVMKDHEAVEAAVEAGARRLDETDLELEL
ncbi:MAG: hypothetical protein U5J98_08525 [Halobacteriales archaeon]|nr:hypothetical protein [Halobacteriales archaeon]